MRVFATVFLCLFLGGCGYGASTQVAPGSQVGGVGNIQYDHKQLNSNTHMTTVHVSPGMLETEVSMSQRMIAFTNEFAAQTCLRIPVKATMDSDAWRPLDPVDDDQGGA